MAHTYIIAFWSPFPTSMTGFCKRYFTPFFKDFGDIQCLDLQQGSDARTRRLMLQADLVVVTIRQSHRELHSLFCETIVPCKNCVYVITDYIPGLDWSLNDISFEFRIPKTHLGCIPYCLGMGTERRPIDTNYCYMNFDREMQNVGNIILRALGF